MMEARLGTRRGIALPVAILALVGMAAIPAVLLAISWGQGRTERDRRDAALAVELAEAASAHAAGFISAGPLKATSFNALLLGADGRKNTADDGILQGFGITSNSIPAGGRAFAGGTYFVRILDDPADTDGDPLVDSNGQIRIECTGQTTGGSRATANLIWTRVSPLNLSVVVGGGLRMESPEFRGSCKSLYADDSLWINGADFPEAKDGMAYNVKSGKTAGLTPVDSLVAGANAALSLPQVRNPSGSCPAAATVGNWGTPNQPISASTLQSNRWYCYTGNIYLSGATSSNVNVTIVADGHIRIINSGSGKFDMRGLATDGTALLAGGDVYLEGDVSIDGAIYCGSQFNVSGLDLKGQIVCADDLDPAAAGGVVLWPENASGSGNNKQVLWPASNATVSNNSPFGMSIWRPRKSGNKDIPSVVNFACNKGKYVRPGFELSRVAWYPTYGN